LQGIAADRKLVVTENMTVDGVIDTTEGWFSAAGADGDDDSSDLGRREQRRIEMTGNASVLGSLHSVDGEGVVRMEDRLDTGIDDLWGALTDPDRLAHWFGEVEGELSQGGEFRVHIALAGQRAGRVEACEPPRRLLLTMRDRDPQPGQPEQTVIEAQLIAEGAQTALVWEERGMPVNLLPAYGAGIQIHVEHLADYISGRELRNVETRWNELFPAYEALAVG
jgi:uncharacterized protein YndB with AHSA1/START domain